MARAGFVGLCPVGSGHKLGNVEWRSRSFPVRARRGKRSVPRAAEEERQRIPREEALRVWSRAEALDVVRQIAGASTFDEQTQLRIFYMVGLDKAELEKSFGLLAKQRESVGWNEAEFAQGALRPAQVRFSELCECIEEKKSEAILAMDLSRVVPEEPQAIALGLAERYRKMLWVKSLSEASTPASQARQEAGLEPQEYDDLSRVASRIKGPRLLQAMSIVYDLMDNLVTQQGDKDSLLADAVAHLTMAFAEEAPAPRKLRNLSRAMNDLPGLASMVSALPESLLQSMPARERAILEKAVTEQNLLPEELSVLGDMGFVSGMAGKRGYDGDAWSGAPAGDDPDRL